MYSLIECSVHRLMSFELCVICSQRVIIFMHMHDFNNYVFTIFISMIVQIAVFSSFFFNKKTKKKSKLLTQRKFYGFYGYKIYYNANKKIIHEMGVLSFECACSYSFNVHPTTNYFQIGVQSLQYVGSSEMFIILFLETFLLYELPVPCGFVGSVYTKVLLR